MRTIVKTLHTSRIRMQSILNHLIRLALKIRFYYLVFWILFIFSKKEFKKNGIRNTVLYLSKPIFNDDVDTLKKYGKQFDYISFPRMLLFPILHHFIPFAHELNDANYHLRIKDSNEVDKFRNFWDSCILFLKRKLKFDLILSGNFVYITQQEMIRSAKKIGIPFVVLYKEGLFPTDRNVDIINIYYTTKVFLADKILFYNEGIRDILVKSNLPGLSSDKTAVVGVPRFDYLVKEKKLVQQNKKNIVLFAFDPRSKSEYLLNDKLNQISYEQVLFEFQANIIFCVKNNLDLNLIIKSKADPRSRVFVDELLDYCGCNPLPKNIITSHNLNVQQLIKESSIVAGYSSTTLIEALIQNKNIICPDVFNFFKEKSVDLFQGLELGIEYVKDMDQIRRVLEEERSQIDTFKKGHLEIFLRSMVYKLDGMSCNRVEVELNELIN